jgi:hypothetical protein
MPAPAAKTRVSEGRSDYQALTFVSVPQRSPESGLLTGQNDLVEPGMIVKLTEQEAANLMATGGKTGRQAPAVRPVSEQGDPLPRLLPRQLSGRLRQPVTPPPGSDLPRPDPPGSSHVIVNEPGPPEGNEPSPGDEQGMPTGAMDLPPRHARTAAT